MARKATVKIPGAPETAATKAESAGRVSADDVLAAEAAPVAAAAAGDIDPITLKRAVFIEGKGWLCPQPKLSATKA